jgi:Fe-S cluster assembly protein SufD
MSATLATRIAEEFAATANPDSQRRLALDTLLRLGLPTARDENWKYVNLRPLERVRFSPAELHALPAIGPEVLPAPVAGYSRYVFIDGQFSPDLSSSESRKGVFVESMKSAPVAASCLAATDVAPDLRFGLLNAAFASDGASIRLEPGGATSACMELVFVATTDFNAGASYPRIDVRVGAGARLGLIERHVSAGTSASFVNSAVEVTLDKNARADHYRVQQLGSRAIWFDSLTAKLAERACYQIHAVNLGAQSARSTMHIGLAGEHSEVSLLAACVGDRNQVQDTFALIEHIAPNARTQQVFRGIAGGRARVACNGKIIVHAGAYGTDSRQSLRGLLAGKDAEIDVRPQLEIHTDDVRCSHGATAGKLDDNMLFYLLSRGLDRETAQRLLKWAFLEDVVARVEVPELRRQIERSLAGHLGDTADLADAAEAASPPGTVSPNEGAQAGPANRS